MVKFELQLMHSYTIMYNYSSKTVFYMVPCFKLVYKFVTFCRNYINYSCFSIFIIFVLLLHWYRCTVFEVV